jgi:Zn finger protein HypA/HybF involved in hydrogenase expression
MKNIEKATYNLLEKINSLCPKCSTPGFDIIQRIQGLPCEWCSTPTTLTKAAIYKCQKCGFSKEKLFPNGKEFANPAQCMYCNP